MKHNKILRKKKTNSKIPTKNFCRKNKPLKEEYDLAKNNISELSQIEETLTKKS